MTTRAEKDNDVQAGRSGPVDHGVYVYGILNQRQRLPEELPSVGDQEAAVKLVSHGELSALVSEVELVRPLGIREDLLAHERVLDTLAADTAVIPMRFGAVVSSVDAVVDELLAPHHDHFEAMLSELAGSVQYTIRGRYADSAHIREVVAEEPAVQELRETLRGVPEEAGYAERLRLGELVNQAVVRKREADTEELITSVSSTVLATNPHQVPAEDDAVDVAFLVDRDQVPQFEQAVDELGERWDRRINLRLIGPLAPYDFLPEV
ncbi:GvpL/GvpF family gas vesicle protein [Saccharopolyspora phatthalungensis]|uniref:Gas vesicle protein GvpL/GvpF n=1 Tax=Saccharopolyspora phatthalungensis TaxID=664693 RepID=A0A840QK87_9PSEU|nr:GvpL/GvpF family gas vesicle protein [Saccharopolyspora phatthalungensis]MBB5158673.1 hypothetical protein [Saccharopolyspora phatthalungensis]